VRANARPSSIAQRFWALHFARACQSLDVAEELVRVSVLCIELDRLTGAERRDLANALLNAAWSAVLEETRILLLDLMIEANDSLLEDAS
jgi:hypothetical protein